MKLAILHIGLEKTGTTSIQATLAKARPALLQQGIHFPECLGAANHLTLAAALQDEEKRDDLRVRFGLESSLQIEKFRNELAGKLRAEVADRRAGTLIISSEHLSSRLCSETEIERLREMVLQSFSPDQSKVIVYLRGQDELCRSLYHTSIANGSTRQFSYPSLANCPFHFHFDSLIALWKSVWGSEAVFPRHYSKADLVEGSSVADFFATAGIDFDWTDFVDHPRNRSLDGDQLEALRQENASQPVDILSQIGRAERADRIETLRSASTEVEVHGWRKGREAFMSQFSSGNRKVAEEYFGGNPI